MQLLKIGNRLIDVKKIVTVSYDPKATHPMTVETWSECIVSFGCDDVQIFYEEEADIVWEYLCSDLNSRSINSFKAEVES